MTLQTWFSTKLSSKLTETDTTMTVETVPSATSWRLYLTDWTNEEWISYTWISGSTLTWLTRKLSTTAIPSVSTWDWYVRASWQKVLLVIMHDQLLDLSIWTTQSIPWTIETVYGLKTWRVLSSIVSWSTIYAKSTSFYEEMHTLALYNGSNYLWPVWCDFTSSTSSSNIWTLNTYSMIWTVWKIYWDVMWWHRETKDNTTMDSYTAINFEFSVFPDTNWTTRIWIVEDEDILKGGSVSWNYCFVEIDSSYVATLKYNEWATAKSISLLTIDSNWGSFKIKIDKWSQVTYSSKIANASSWTTWTHANNWVMNSTAASTLYVWSWIDNASQDVKMTSIRVQTGKEWETYVVSS